MSRDDIERHPIPTDRYEQYIVYLLIGAQAFGIDPNTPAGHFLALLIKQLERDIFEQTHKMPPEKKLSVDMKKFIAIFKQRYLQLLDMEYVRTVSPVDCKLIKQVSKALTDEGFEMEDFLKWLFEDFLQENPKFQPPSMKWACCGFVVDKYRLDNKHKLVQKREEEVKKKEMIDLINRARQVLRGFAEAGQEEDKEKVKELLRKVSERSIMLTEMRSCIEGFETRLRQTGQNRQGGADGHSGNNEQHT